MTPEKRSSKFRGPFGFTTRDIIFLSLLVIGLAIGLIVAYQWRKVAPPSTTPSAEKSAQASLSSQPSETPTTPPTPEPTQTTTPLPPTSTIVKPTPQPTDTPSPTLTPTKPAPAPATATATLPPIPTDETTSSTPPTSQPPPTTEPTTEPTQEATIEPTVEPTNESTVELPPLPPAPATIIYVQSSNQVHDLGLVTSSGNVLNPSLRRYAAAPAWSQDGKRIAFFEEPINNQNNGVWLINPQGQDAKKLKDVDRVKNIAWSPDGLKLAYEFDDNGVRKVEIIDARDGQSLCPNFSSEQPAWSWDSQSLIVKACLPGCGLWQVDLKGNKQRQITFYQNDSYPALSPDGQYLAFSSNENEDTGWDIYLLSLPDGKPKNLTQRPSTDTTPVFSPDSKKIYLQTDGAKGAWQITAISLDGSNEWLIKEGVGESDDWGLARPAVN